jgi:hypothetical protein
LSKVDSLIHSAHRLIDEERCVGYAVDIGSRCRSACDRLDASPTWTVRLLGPFLSHVASRHLPVPSLLDLQRHIIRCLQSDPSHSQASQTSQSWVSRTSVRRMKSSREDANCVFSDHASHTSNANALLYIHPCSTDLNRSPLDHKAYRLISLEHSRPS